MNPLMGVSLAARLLHALLLALATGVLAADLTLPAGLVAAVFAAFSASLIAEHHSRVGYRTTATLALAGLVAVLGLSATGALLNAESVAISLGATETMALAEFLRWATIAFAGALVLRSLALKFRAALAIEGSAAVLVVASQVAAHRDGMIARPLEISDWFWRQNIDPVLAFLGLGLVGALLLAGVLAYGRSARRTFAQLVCVLLLGLALTAYLHQGPPETPLRNAVGGELNKTKDGKRDGPASAGAGSSGQGHGDERRSNSEDDDLPPPPPKQGGKNRPAAIVVFHRNVRPFGETFYFRHAAFSQFNGARLIEATVAGVDPDARYARSGEQNIEGIHNNSWARATVATDVAVLSEHSRTFALIDASRVQPRPNPEPARFRRAYRVISSVPTATVAFDDLLGLAGGADDWEERLWSHYTETPHDERYHDLARRLQAGLRDDYKSDPMALAFTIKRYLETNAIYSFQRKYVGKDPTAEFLFSEEKRGYCVHLAHAAAYLLRALGVPTRVSAGYAVPASNLGRGSALLIKDGDAHAWAEIYLAGVGWVPIEVTPEKTDIEPPQFSEQDLQQLLGEMARQEGRFERAAAGPSRWVQWLKAALARSHWGLLLALLVAYSIKGWRHLQGLRGGSRGTYRAATDALAAVGWIRQPGESRERFAIRVARAVPAYGALTEHRMAEVLGGAPPASAGIAVSLYRSVLSEARRSVPGWRLFLGLLNPVSWMWSK